MWDFSNCETSVQTLQIPTGQNGLAQFGPGNGRTLLIIGISSNDDFQLVWGPLTDQSLSVYIATPASFIKISRAEAGSAIDTPFTVICQRAGDTATVIEFSACAGARGIHTAKGVKYRGEVD